MLIGRQVALYCRLPGDMRVSSQVVFPGPVRAPAWPAALLFPGLAPDFALALRPFGGPLLAARRLGLGMMVVLSRSIGTTSRSSISASRRWVHVAAVGSARRSRSSAAGRPVGHRRRPADVAQVRAVVPVVPGVQPLLEPGPRPALSALMAATSVERLGRCLCAQPSPAAGGRRGRGAYRFCSPRHPGPASARAGGRVAAPVTWCW